MTEPCDWCHPLDGRRPGVPVRAACVHEHISEVTLCDVHRRVAFERPELTYLCEPCKDAGFPDVPVTVVRD